MALLGPADQARCQHKSGLIPVRPANVDLLPLSPINNNATGELLLCTLQERDGKAYEPESLVSIEAGHQLTAAAPSDQYTNHKGTHRRAGVLEEASRSKGWRV